jgi:hypothetical protein
VERCHEKWWAVVKDAAQKGKDAAAAFQTLCDADKPLPKQRLIQSVQKSRPGRLAKEVAFLVFLLRNRVAFHVVDDKVSMDPFKKQFDVNLRGEESFKGLTLLCMRLFCGKQSSSYVMPVHTLSL